MTRGGMRRAGRDPWWDGARLPGSGSRKHVTLFVLAKNVLAKKKIRYLRAPVTTHRTNDFSLYVRNTRSEERLNLDPVSVLRLSRTR